MRSRCNYYGTLYIVLGHGFGDFQVSDMIIQAQQKVLNTARHGIKMPACSKGIHIGVHLLALDSEDCFG
jgi:hypothetical protein